MGQSGYHLSFEGMLSDIEGGKISNDQFDLVVKLQYKSDQEVLHEFRKSLSSDQIPFAYLTGGFQLANQNPPDEQLLEDLKTWISPSEDEESDARSRSVKGGFPTGGYHRTKK